ncbi:MAG: NADH-dependent [FeFe] hydrogenase, group A6 [Acidaminococcaceae bacterium]|nr:NADH-dependent [FeFe] hydrogenase, group A6 [Acidaminococcaceae bacterium]
MLKNVDVVINGETFNVPDNITIMEAARRNGIKIPSLCHFPDQRVKANCRVCVVEVEGSRNLVASCSTPVREGMKVRTTSARVRETVQTILELIFANHPQECLTCIRNENCELRQLAAEHGIREIKADMSTPLLPLDTSTAAIVRDPNKCIKCGRCAEVCHHVQTTGILYSHNRGLEGAITPEYGKTLSEVACVLCGQCVLVCPTGAIHEKDDTAQVWAALENPEKHVVVQVAPSVRVSIAEEMGQAPGTIATGKLVTALRRLGFDKVFDTDFTADLTILEEGNELLHRLKTGGTLPMITSCSPGWIKFIEHNYPEQLANLSSCKSPQQMFGALAKTFYAKQSGIDAKDITVVSIMPCTAKKYECTRPEMQSSGYQDVDYVLTTREFGRMLRQAGVNFSVLADSGFDNPLGMSTGAGAIFGATGGVMEAALRTVYEVVTGKELQKLEFESVRGLEGVKEAIVDLDGLPVKVAVAHGLGNARKIMEKIKDGTADYTFVEVMACPGGCIGGGGQPYLTRKETRMARMDAIYEVDEHMPLRKSHENPAVQQLYKDFLKEPLGEMSHHLLHTRYTKRGL